MTIRLNDETTARDYLTDKGIPFDERGGELVTKCLFADCDRDSRGREAHLYVHPESGLYDCKKCGARGNLRTLAAHLGDGLARKTARARATVSERSVLEWHAALPDRVRDYLRGRGLTDAVIDAHRLGYGTFYGQSWITIPIADAAGRYAFLKLRQDPEDGSRKITYPSGVEATLYGQETLAGGDGPVVLCEGELDRLALVSRGVAAVTGTHGAGTFKEPWAAALRARSRVYVCYDRDDAGRRGAAQAAEAIAGHRAHAGTFVVSLPESVGDGGDVTDFLLQGGSPDDLTGALARPYPERIDTSKFAPLAKEELTETLGLTIKQDEGNKLATFLCLLSAYTESAQINVSFNAPSSTGKSFIPTEVARLFPEEDVMELAHVTPTAFFYDTGEFDKERNRYLVDLSRKIIIFLDQPHNDLLARLRPLLSHDKKEIAIKMTDKNQRAGTKTKNVLLRGYPAVVFCTAGLRIDEQEATRFLLLSPQTSQEKLRLGIQATIRKGSDAAAFASWLEEHPARALLKERVRAIRQEGIREINISDGAEVERRFFGSRETLKPRHQRDIKRLLSLIKAFALLNVWWRERDGGTLVANREDIEAGFALWESLSASQELNLPPYVYDLYHEVILPAWRDKNHGQEDSLAASFGADGITRQEILDKHYAVHGRTLDGQTLRQQILPTLESAGLVTQEPDPTDRRKMLVFPAESRNGGNSGARGGVGAVGETSF